MASLDPALLKLRRADEHIEDIKERIRRFSGQPYKVISHFDKDTGKWELRLSGVKNIPETWPLIIGDAVNNLRSALDHLMWNLVLLNNGGPARGTQFPISINGNSYDGDTGQLTAGASVAHIAKIKSLQPYHRVGTEQTHPLFWVNELARFDKHRVLLLSEIAIPSGGIGIQHLEGFDLQLDFVRTPEAQDGAVLSRFKLIKRVANAKVQMRPDVPCEIRFKQGSPDCVVGKTVTEVLIAIRNYISDDVIEQFRADF
jgi:hypothetical protein